MHYGMTYRKGNSAHKSLNGVMSNSGFGLLKVTLKNGLKVAIPAKGLTKDGRIKKSWLKQVKLAAMA